MELASTRGTRRVPVAEFITGPKRNALRPDELIAAFHIPRAEGPQQYSKIGTRNAMVIAVCAFGLALHPEQRKVGTCLGSAAPTPVRAREAEGVHPGHSRMGGARGDRRDGALSRSASWWKWRRLPKRRPRHRRLQNPRGRRARAAHAQVGLGRVQEGRVVRLRLEVNGEVRGGGRRMGGREPPLRAARAPRSPRLQERLRAGRVRLLAPSTSTACRLLLPGSRGPGRGPEVITVEGIAEGQELHPVQTAF